ncbi:MAG TPA: DUF255 domain-containing protein [Thermoanaerobaculia bacterium]|nr:DUF255 domain-containing protein [Thermoanaerobaculia bacterium]
MPPHAPSATAHENRLGAESSPYLLLHRHNPVDWYPWGEEALARAREEDRPIFLSVGYSTCYWCHVMERESFSNPATAELMNREFVNVKLDREERPDLDEVYMTATQILTGQGGWPNSVFLTPDLEPFYAGTYFPPEDRYGRPGFPNLLRGLAAAWRDRRDEVTHQAEELTAALRRYLEERVRPGETPPGPEVVAPCLDALARRFDHENGGFSAAPKFPTPSNLFFLLELAGEEPRAAEMLAATLDRMARGGICDHLGGGFHRYATDRAWRVPHFEKMLYDNALLLELYAREHARTGDPEAARVARETAAFLERELSLEDGGFASALDAETDGHEGAFYVWSGDELRQVLGDEDFAFAAPLLGFAGPPFFEERSYVLHLPEPLDAAAARRGTAREALLAELAPIRRRLFDARAERKRPLTDDKALADWNGMAVGGLAVAGRLLAAPELVARAARAADFVLDRLRPDGGPLLHAWRAGTAKVPAMLADYAWTVRGLLALDGATGEERWRAAAVELAEEMVERLADPTGGFWTAEASPDLLVRTKEIFDGATPAANAIAALDLLTLARRTGEGRWRELARGTLAAAAPLVEQFPDGGRTMVLAARRWHAAEAGADEATRSGERSAGARGLAGLTGEAERVVELAVEAGEPAADGTRRFELTLTIAPGWHVNAHQVTGEAAEWLTPTAVRAEGGELIEVTCPAGDRGTVPGAGAEVAVYSGRVTISGTLRPSAAATPELVVTYQPCDDRRCLPPIERRLRIG